LAVSQLLLIRHGRTPWNDAGRIQGQRDIGLSEAGRAELAERGIPHPYAHFRWYASPLTRARQSARILGARDLKIDPRLVELHWGEWQGWTRQALRAHQGEAFAENEARGLAFRPPGGESPGELRLRLEAWLADLCVSGQSVIAVTHKGVVQMALALATGWDLVSRAPVRLDWQCGHLFSLGEAPSTLRVEQLNVALDKTGARSGGADT
jgi:broad specificity phosphatase PhoE